MPRLVDADALLEQEFFVDDEDGFGCSAVLSEDIRRAPTIDPESLRPHGKWRRSGMLIECCFCGEIYSLLGGNDDKSWNACPSCTAIMDLEEEMTIDQD